MPRYTRCDNEPAEARRSAPQRFRYMGGTLIRTSILIPNFKLLFKALMCGVVLIFWDNNLINVPERSDEDIILQFEAFYICGLRVSGASYKLKVQVGVDTNQ